MTRPEEALNICLDNSIFTEAEIASQFPEHAHMLSTLLPVAKTIKNVIPAEQEIASARQRIHQRLISKGALPPVVQPVQGISRPEDTTSIPPDLTRPEPANIALPSPPLTPTLVSSQFEPDIAKQDKRATTRLAMRWPSVSIWVRAAVVLFTLGAAALIVDRTSAQSLPDSPLYPIKLNIERFHLFAANSNKDHADLDITYAQVRLDEINRLVNNKQQVNSTVLNNLTAHVNSASTYLDTLPADQKISVASRLANLTQTQQVTLLQVQSDIAPQAKIALDQAQTASIANHQKALKVLGQPVEATPANQTPYPVPSSTPFMLVVTPSSTPQQNNNNDHENNNKDNGNLTIEPSNTPITPSPAPIIRQPTPTPVLTPSDHGGNTDGNNNNGSDNNGSNNNGNNNSDEPKIRPSNTPVPPPPTRVISHPTSTPVPPPSDQGGGNNGGNNGGEQKTRSTPVPPPPTRVISHPTSTPVPPPSDQGGNDKGGGKGNGGGNDNNGKGGGKGNGGGNDNNGKGGGKGNGGGNDNNGKGGGKGNGK